MRTLRLARKVLIVRESADSSRRRIGRRRGNSSEPRKTQHHVRVNADEEAALLALALRRNVSVPRLLVEAALEADAGMSHSDLTDLGQTLFGLSRQIGAVGVNLNQLAKVANATGEVPDDLAAAVSGIRMLGRKVEAALDHVGQLRRNPL